jgi:sec-independent protein translocase protein TatC
MQTPRSRVSKKTDKEGLAEGTLLSHLVELRDRLIRSLLAVVVIFVPLLPFNQKIFEFAAAPISAALPAGTQLIATAPLQALLTPFKLTFYIAFLLAMPVVLYQIWAFVAPGLYRKEKRFAFPLLGSSILLFYLGAAFAFYVVGPLIFTFTAALAENSAAFELLPEVKEYLGLLTSLVLVFGLAFEIPIATVLLVWTGLVSTKKLASIRP